MTKKLLLILVTALAVLALSACGGDAEPSVQTESGTQSDSPVEEKAAEPVTVRVQLSEGYADALSLDGQLAIGTVQLDDTDLAVDAEQAAELIPLWQAFQSLSSSDTTAEAELQAVLKQIQGTMTAEQIAAIADMQLTADKVTELVEEGIVAFGRGGFRGTSGEGEAGGGFPGGAFPGGLPGQGPGGGGPGGGLPGGRPGGGFGEISADDIATRQAQFTEGDFGGFQARMLTGIVIRSLQTKTGETPELEGIFGAIFDIIAEETGITAEEIREQSAEGTTLAEIIESNGAYVDDIQAKLIAALSETDQFRGQDLEEFLSNLLN
ncbi:MAG TPA: hypothetical protein VFI27_10870 [candidate division Zixibacteria bacterium]|nr:hypothetical protein [candidate division Zixibacteria bacterium]